MMMFGFMWIIILLVIIIPIVLLLALLFRPGILGQYRNQKQQDVNYPKVEEPPKENIPTVLDSPTGPENLGWQCVSCGGALQPEWTHCPNCGTPIR